MADLKITQLTAEASPALDDLMVIVDDVAGTPTTKKATLANVLALASGGNTSSTSAHASPPSSPSAGDLWLPTNSFYLYRYSGSVWVPWGPIFPMEAPDLGDFTWVNQGGATAVDTNGGIHLICPASATYDVRALVKSAPSTPYTITAAFTSARPVFDFLSIGLLFRQSSDGKLHVMQHFIDNGHATGGMLQSTKYAAPDSPTAHYTTLDVFNQQLWWMQISDTGTDRILRWSTDGQNWRVFHSIGRTDYLTADQVGFFANSITASFASDITLFSWKET